MAALLQTVAADCLESLNQNKRFRSCIDTYTMYDKRAKNRGDMTGIQILCNPEVTNLMECIYGFVDKCPEIKSKYKLPDHDVFSRTCNSNGYNAGMGAQDPPQCRELVGTCTAQSGGVEDDDMNSQTPFGAFPKKLKHICGTFKTTMECLNRHKEECPQGVSGIMNAINNAQTTENYSPKYETLEAFMKHECPNLPDDIDTNTCVSDNLKSQVFVECFQAVFKAHDPNSCGAVLAGRQCFKTSIEIPCGRKYANIFYISTPIFIADVPDNCELPTSDIPATEEMPVTESNVEPVQNVHGEPVKVNDGIVTRYWNGLILFTNVLSIGTVMSLY